MKIIPTLFNYNLNQTKSANFKTRPLPFDSVSFSAMKKSQFEGIDLMMANQLKAPIQKFSSNDDFQNYCQSILDEKYLGKENFERLSNSLDGEAKQHKKAILKDWINYITVENKAYTPAIQLMILSSITKNLNYETNHLPAVLDKRKLADTIQEISTNAKTQKNYTCNFDKLYRNNLLTTAFESETQLDSSLNGWIKIPSKANDPTNFSENVKKLQILSHDSWCTKTYNAEPYLAKGDFHIYFEQGKPKIGLRFDRDTLEEIQGEKNNGEIPYVYFNQLNDYLNLNNFQLSFELQDKIDFAKERKEFYDLIGEEAIKSKDIERILPFYGLAFEKDSNGMLILDTFRCDKSFQPRPLNISELGISCDDILSKVVKIKNYFIAIEDKVTTTGNIEEIEGSFAAPYSTIKTLGKIKKIGGNLECSCTFSLSSLGDLKHVGGNITLLNRKELQKEVLNLDYIGGQLSFKDPLKTYKQPNLLLSSTPLSRPITYDEYEEWKIDEKNLTLDEIQGKINNEDFDDIMASFFGDVWKNV